MIKVVHRLAERAAVRKKASSRCNVARRHFCNEEEEEDWVVVVTGDAAVIEIISSSRQVLCAKSRPVKIQCRNLTMRTMPGARESYF